MTEVLVNGKPVRYDTVPVPYMVDGLRLHIEFGGPTGSFLFALLCGDFFEMARRADDNNMAAFQEWARWFYNYAPQGCFGSMESVAEWRKHRSAEAAG